jgi:hypothetical protein
VRRDLILQCLTFALAISLLSCIGCAAEPVTSTASSSRLAVRVAGHELVNGAGQPIRLLGVARSGGEYPCIQGWGLIDGPTGWPAVAAMASWASTLSGSR